MSGEPKTGRKLWSVADIELIKREWANGKRAKEIARVFSPARSIHSVRAVIGRIGLRARACNKVGAPHDIGL
jgi:hypothetical protein